MTQTPPQSDDTGSNGPTQNRSHPSNASERTPANPTDAHNTVQPKAGTSPDEAIAALLQTHGTQIYNLALRLCNDPQTAADVVQDTFLGAWKSWPTFRGDSLPSTWLYRIAARACQKHRRTEARQSAHAVPLEHALPSSGAVPDVLATDTTPLSESVRREAIEAIEREITRLPDEYRLPIVLKEIAGLSVQQTARVLDMKEATVKTRLHRGRLALYNALTKSVPTRDAPPPQYDKKVCLDLLDAKQEALDRGEPFPELDSVTCERCRAVFKSLDIATDLCHSSSTPDMPESLRQKILSDITAGQ